VWQKAAAEPKGIEEAGSYADWLGTWFSEQTDLRAAGASSGSNGLLRWKCYEDEDLLEDTPDADTPSEAATAQPAPDPEALTRLQQRLAWVYPFLGATRQPAKTSVSLLRRQASLAPDEDAAPFVPERSPTARALTRGKPSGADLGTAHHLFLRWVALERAGSEAGLKTEAERLTREGKLTAEQAGLVRLPWIYGFYQTDLGRATLAEPADVRRELEFTARFSAPELMSHAGLACEPGLADEFVVVQGVADLVVMRDKDIWLVDFKTDAVAGDALAARVKEYEPQLRLYATALERIYQKPVSAAWLFFLATTQAVKVDPAPRSGPP
jgi:ATP-dependent helicase/nuclease subunit A